MSKSGAEPKPFEGRLVFDGGRACDVVEGSLARVDDPHGRKRHSGRMWCELPRTTLEILGPRATLHTAGGLKARIEIKGVVRDEDEGGSILEFDTVGSADAGSFDAP